MRHISYRLKTKISLSTSLLLKSLLCYAGLSFSQTAFAEGCTNTSQSDTLSFGQHSSIDIVKTEQTASSTNAGLKCQGSFLTLLGNGNHILAQLSSTNNGR